MSNSEPLKMSKSQRVEYAARVKSLRQAAGFTQDELAAAAGVSRQTVIGIELADRVPQQEKLLPVLAVLGVDVDAPRFGERTELWLSMMGSLIEAIPTPRREPTVDRAIRVLADGIQSGEDAGLASVTPIGLPDVGAAGQDSDLYDEEARAASKKNARPAETMDENIP